MRIEDKTSFTFIFIETSIRLLANAYLNLIQSVIVSEIQKLFYLTNIAFLKAPAVRLMDAFYTMNNTGFCLDSFS